MIVVVVVKKGVYTTHSAVQCSYIHAYIQWQLSYNYFLMFIPAGGHAQYT